MTTSRAHLADATGLRDWLQHNAGKAPALAPRETDVIEFEHVTVTDGIAVVEYASMQDFLRSQQGE